MMRLKHDRLKICAYDLSQRIYYSVSSTYQLPVSPWGSECEYSDERQAYAGPK